MRKKGSIVRFCCVVFYVFLFDFLNIYERGILLFIDEERGFRKVKLLVRGFDWEEVNFFLVFFLK